MKTNYLKFLRTLFCSLAMLTISCKNQEPKNQDTMVVSDGIPQEKTILIVLSGQNKLEVNDIATKTTSEINTGYFLDELVVPAQALVAAGYKLEVATPDGVVAVMDGNSNNADYFNGDKAILMKAVNFVREYPAFNHPLKLEEVANTDLSKYSAIFLPGGRAPMTDLMQSAALGKVFRTAHEKAIITAIICHGPVALTAALKNPVAYRKALVAQDQKAIAEMGKDWIYAGYEMTIFSNSEEDDALKEEPFRLQFYVADALRSAGAKVKHGKENWKPFVVQDRELITGQNPASDHAIAETLLKALSSQQR